LPHVTPNLVPYDIVYVRAPRFGDTTNSVWPDTVRPRFPDGGAELHLLHPNCPDEPLCPRPPDRPPVDATIGRRSAADPSMSFDGQWVVFTYCHDQSDQNAQRCAGEDECLSPTNGGLLVVPLPQPVDLAARGATLSVQIADQAGQITHFVRTFSPSLFPACISSFRSGSAELSCAF
jgi:hypothetical protein